jgi:hypothetical protein
MVALGGPWSAMHSERSQDWRLESWPCSLVIGSDWRPATARGVS